MCLVIFSCFRTHVQPEGGSGFSVQITDKGAVSFLFVIGERGGGLVVVSGRRIKNP